MSNPVPCWAPRGVRPVLPLQRQRQYRNVFGAVCPRTGGLFHRTAERNNAELMRASFSRASKRRVVMAEFGDFFDLHFSCEGVDWVCF